MDYKQKINKLLKLAESPNEHEARAALLKARALMAEHKLTERECTDVKNQKVVQVYTDITCSARRDPWIANLTATIGTNYCSQAIRQHQKGRQTMTLGFIGFEDDVEVCIAVFKYAVDCVQSITKIMRRNLADEYSSDSIRDYCNSYGYGFNKGVAAAFQKQQEENEEGWGLVLVMPQEVKDAVNSLTGEHYKAPLRGNIHASAYEQGREDGSHFNPAARLQEA